MKVCTACYLRFNSPEWRCPSCHFMPEIEDGYLSFAPELAQENEGFEVHFFELLVTLEAKNFWFCARNRLLLWALQSYFPEMQTFLEIGCGTGFVLSSIERAFPALKLWGSEIFTKGLSVASHRLSRTQLFQMDARYIPFESEFDVIGAFDVLEHIREDTTVLAELFQAVKTGIILTVPQHLWLWSQADEHAHHVRRYHLQELRKKVTDAGFQVVYTTSFVSLLLPLMLLSRLGKPKGKQDYDPTDELKLPPWINGILETILNLERFLIQRGISFPIGGSLLLIAKK